METPPSHLPSNRNSHNSQTPRLSSLPAQTQLPSPHPTQHRYSEIMRNDCNQTTISAPFTAISSLSNSKTIIVKNPKGKLLHGCIFDVDQERLAREQNEANFEDNFTGFRELLAMGDNEILQQNLNIDESIGLYNKHRFWFAMLMMFQFLFDMAYNVWSWWTLEDTLQDMGLFYAQLDQSQLKIFYWTIYSGNCFYF